MRREAFATARCIATDATGVLVQPSPRPDKQSQPCRRAHFFVQIADAAAADRAACREVGCWSHGRTKLWEAAVATQHVVAREALARIFSGTGS